MHYIGSREFRTQLGKKSQDEIIEALKQLTEEVVFEHSEALHLIFLLGWNEEHRKFD